MTRYLAIWFMVGLGVGCFWVWMGFLFFTAPESLVVSVFKGVAAVTCPPILFTDIILSPPLNAVVYVAIGFVLLLFRGRRTKAV